MRELTKAELTARERLSGDTDLFTFSAVDGRFGTSEPGAHVDLHLPGGLVRTYSLTDWDRDGTWVQVAVKREEGGRGGSIAVHALPLGAILELSAPRNDFPLHLHKEPVVLLGGGIGITPLFAMARQLKALRRTFTLHYLTRTRTFAAFDAALQGLALDDYRLHCDDTDGLPDLRAIVAANPEDTHYYVCGPEVVLTAVQKASTDLGRGHIHFERFTASVEADVGPRKPFIVSLACSGEEHEVPADRSILEVLRAAGHDIDYSCGEGSCGTCIVDVLEGEIDHRDTVLDPDERAAGDCMCVCVSRARSSRLVLDL